MKRNMAKEEKFVKVGDLRNRDVMKRNMTEEEQFEKEDALSNSDVSPEQERKSALNWWKFLNIVLFVVIVLVGFVLHCVNSRNCERQKEELQRQKKELQERISRLEKENADLKDITEKADIRLSKMIAERALDRNDGVSKLEENSPMKLAEKFRDIYDNEYTEAFEELNMKHGETRTKKLTKQLLDILEMANNLCVNYSTHHQKSIEQSASSLQVLVPPSHVTLKHSKNTTTYVSDGISLRRHWKETFCIRRSCPKGKQKQIVEENPGSEEPVESPENTTTYVTDGISLRRHWKETFCIRRSCPKGKQKQIVEENPGSEEPVESPEDKVNVTVVEEKLSDRELKQIYEIRTAVAYRIQDRLIKVLLQVIVNTFDFDIDSQPFLIKYIRKCLSLCWLMNMHSNPVFIKFVKASKGTKFDTKAFEPFLTSGKYLDYVVWPPLYLHEGGHMLGKGFAEGRN